MNSCVIPAPAPWAKMKHACAVEGRSSSADTSSAPSILSFNFCGLTMFIRDARCFLIPPPSVGTRPERSRGRGGGDVTMRALGVAVLHLAPRAGRGREYLASG